MQLECARVLNETLLVPVLKWSSINAVQIDNLRGLLGIRRMIGLLRGSMQGSVLVVVQWVVCGRGD